MTRSDIPLFGAQLNALAEVFGKPPISVKAMEVWFDALKEFPIERVMDVVNGWARFNGRFPMPAQVWERVNEKMIESREQRAAFERKQNSGPIEHYVSPAAEKYIEEIRAILKRPVTPMRERWLQYLDDPETPLWKRAMAREAVANLGLKRESKPERIPGEDDEPALGIPLDDLEREFADAANP